jgi:hypothetical protein
MCTGACGQTDNATNQILQCAGQQCNGQCP